LYLFSTALIVARSLAVAAGIAEVASASKVPAEREMVASSSSEEEVPAEREMAGEVAAGGGGEGTGVGAPKPPGGTPRRAAALP
jgi:hypothetical protein